jgi:hypothetical protein
MEVRTDYKFQASVSTDAFVDKTISSAMIGATKKNPKNREIREEYGFVPNRGVGYKEGTFTPQELLSKLTEGHVICQLFAPPSNRIRKDGSFGSSEKNNYNFKGAYFIGVDIDDTKYRTAEEFIKKLELKPTFYYTSYNNQKNGFGARFRMVYVFNQAIITPFLFRYFSLKLHTKIEKDTKEKIKDKCGLNCSQYFNGTNWHSKDIVFSYGITNYIYSLSDLSPSKDDILFFLDNNCFYKKTLNFYEEGEIRYLRNIVLNSNLLHTCFSDWQKNEHYFCDDIKMECSQTLISDMSRLTYDEFMKYNRHRFCYFYRIEKDEWTNFNDKVKYQYVDENYFSLYYNVSKICDGQGRRKKLYQRMCLRRLMKPSVDADTLLFNAYEDLHRFFDNDSKSVSNVITIDELVKNVETVMIKDIGEIEKDLSEIIEYLKSKRPKGGRIYKFNGKTEVGERNTIIKNVRWTMIAENYDCFYSLKNNIQILKTMGIDVSDRTLHRFCDEYDISTKGEYDKILMKYYNFKFSQRRNLAMLTEMGFKISLGKLNKLVKQYTDEALDLRKAG